jgi:transcription antitermination factor NusG
VREHPECASSGQNPELISKFGHGGPRENSGGRREGSGRKRRVPPDRLRLGPRWYVVQTLPRQELRAIVFLSMADFTVRALSFVDNDHPVATQLFPGYLFVHFDADQQDWRVINTDDMPGVHRLFLIDEHTPLPARVGVVERWLADIGEYGSIDWTTPAPEILPGTDVRIVDGPFTSFPAIVQISDDERLTVLVTIFGRTTPVHLRRDQVELA